MRQFFSMVMLGSLLYAILSLFNGDPVSAVAWGIQSVWDIMTELGSRIAELEWFQRIFAKPSPM